jgi:flagellar protein FliO/FliZ
MVNLSRKLKTLALGLMTFGIVFGTSVAMAAPQVKPNIEDTKFSSDPTTDAKPYEGPSMAGILFQMVLGTGVVVGLAYIVIKIYKKNSTNTSQSQFINVVDHYNFGLNKGVFITEVGGRVLVLGVTDHSINVVTEIDDPELIKMMREKAEEQKILGNQTLNPYLQLLKGLMPKQMQNQETFHKHFQNQITKLQGMVNKSPNSTTREDDSNVN